MPYLLRIVASLLGGYLATWGVVSLGIAALVALGVSFHDAETALQLIGFLLFLALFLWAFAARSLIQVWLVLFGGGGLLTAGAWALQAQMLAGA